MLPASRRDDHLYAVPRLEIEQKDFEAFEEELREFHAQFHDCFQRSETRENIFQYMAGQFSALERKSVEPIALHIENASVRSMQRAISDAEWDEEKILARYHGMVAEDMGEPDGVLIFDESAFVKKGSDSAGVGRQYCGRLGKVENCQVGVFAAYASDAGYALIDRRLYVPEKWFTEEYALRRRKCQVPEDLTFKTKAELAAQMMTRIHAQGILSFRYIVADSVYGQNPAFIEAAESLPGKTYYVSIGRDTLCWLTAPLTVTREYRHKKKLLQDGSTGPISVHDLAHGMHDFFWYRRKVSEGAKGPVNYEFSRREIVLARDGMPWKKVWLIVKRTTGTRPEYSYFISNAGRSVRLPLMVWLSGMRWPVEQCFGEAKTELGLAQYEVRKYPGWCHHMLVGMLAHFFLWHLKIRLGKKSTCHYYLADAEAA